MAEDKLEKVIDLYTRRARLYPVLIVTLPMGLAAIAHFEKEPSGWALIWGFLLWCGIAFFLSQVGRDLGVKKQKKLYEKWGGMPTTIMLRHKDTSNKQLLLKRHKKLKELCPEFRLPSPEEEARELKAADEVYDACGAFLRAKTRDQKIFYLLFEENCNYGFRRNLWGMKPVGIGFSIIGICVVAMVTWAKYGTDIMSAPPPVLISGILNIVILACWLFVITPEWVRLAADAYAAQLLLSLDVL